MSEHASLSLLRERVASVPAALRVALAAPLPALAPIEACSRYVVTGGGLSEGPARVLVALLQRGGRDARFVAQSAFAGSGLTFARDTALIAFSQGLAPNARLPLGLGIDPRGAPATTFRAILLVTSVTPSREAGVASIAQRLLDAGHRVWSLPPSSEDRLLLRVAGPAVALVAALRLAAAITQDDASSLAGVVEAAEKRIAEPGVDLFGDERRPIALVAGSSLHDLAMPLRWKLLEGLRVADPPVWDVLQVAHGPLQSFYDEKMTLVVLRTADDELDAIVPRLRAVLHADRHRVVELRSALVGPAALIELDAALDAALVTTLARHPLALDDWPARGLDGPLYDLDPDLLLRRA